MSMGRGKGDATKARSLRPLLPGALEKELRTPKENPPGEATPARSPARPTSRSTRERCRPRRTTSTLPSALLDRIHYHTRDQLHAPPPSSLATATNLDGLTLQLSTQEVAAPAPSASWLHRPLTPTRTWQCSSMRWAGEHEGVEGNASSTKAALPPQGCNWTYNLLRDKADTIGGDPVQAPECRRPRLSIRKCKDEETRRDVTGPRDNQAERRAHTTHALAHKQRRHPHDDVRGLTVMRAPRTWAGRERAG